jgi:hypothetical protein
MWPQTEANDDSPGLTSPSGYNTSRLTALQYFLDAIINNQDVIGGGTILGPRTLADSGFSDPRLIAATAQADT